MPLGLLALCLAYAQRKEYEVGEIFKSVKEQFPLFGKSELYKVIDEIKEFRNTYVAHQDHEFKTKEKPELH